MPAPRHVTLLGCTGSIGTQAIDVIGRHRGRFIVHGLAATGRQADLLARQALATGARQVAVSDPATAPQVRAAFHRLGVGAILTDGPDAITDLAGHQVDTMLNGLAGAAGLPATLAALRAGSSLALANKESLIIAGPLVKRVAAPGQIIAVDSEHSALAQALRCGTAAEVARLVLTASGGPFRGATREELRDVSPAQALAHPTWSMGPLVTVNSATLVNKGMEIIEAHLLFDVPMERIDAVIHPQSVVHSLVEFVDGSSIAQASPPDMRLPIALALSWPQRLPRIVRPIDFSAAARWDFEPIDHEAFPGVALARRAGSAGGTAPAVFNAANEVAVSRFLAGSIGFLDIVACVADALQSHLAPAGDFLASNQVRSLADVMSADAAARAMAASWKPSQERRP